MGAIGLRGVVLKVVLVVLLGGKVVCERQHLGDNGVGIGGLRVKRCNVGLGNAVLFFIVIKNNRPVLCSHVMALAVGCGGVVGGEEHGQQVLKGEGVWVKLNANDFGMACGAGTHGVIRWGGVVPACIAWFAVHYTC